MTEPHADDWFAAPDVPEPVRQRLVTAVSGVLGQLSSDQLPPSLRKVASFAPARRARLAAAPIMAALADSAFRGAVVTRLKLSGDPVLAALAPTSSASAVERAAAAFLVRGDDAQATWDEAVDELGQAAHHEQRQSRLERAEQLAAEVSAVRRQLTDARQRHKEQLAELKGENVQLRRTVNRLRTELREATSAAESARQDADLVAERSAGAATAAEAESRRLRARLAELEAEVQAARRAARDDRDAGTLRARLLLDALVEAAQGLRRELALPPVDVRPADSVAAADPGNQWAGPARALEADDPGMLEELLGLPQVHLVVDGYNITKQEWQTMSLAEQRTRLLRELGGLQARTGAEVTVVFDGADLAHPPTVVAPRGVRVRFSQAGSTADTLIADLVRVEPRGRMVVVASSDREVAETVRRAGAKPVAARALVRLLTR